MNAPPPHPEKRLVLALACGGAGLVLLFSHFIPHLGGPVLLPWTLLPAVPALFVLATAVATYVAFVRSSPDLRKVPSLRSPKGWLLLPLFALLHAMLFGFGGGILGGILVGPPLMAGSLLYGLSLPTFLPLGGFAHRAACDLLLFLALAGAASGAKHAGWMRRFPESDFVRERPPGPRGLWVVLLSALALGSLVVAAAAFAARLDPAILGRVFSPAVER